jgi:hypothetical protein
MQISFKEYVKYRDSNSELHEGLRDGISNVWSGIKNWWSQKPAQASVSSKQVKGQILSGKQKMMQKPPAQATVSNKMNKQKLERKRQERISTEADEALSRLDQPLKDAAMMRDLKQRLVSSSVDPKILSDDKLKGYLDEILSTTRQGGQRGMKIQQIIDSLKGQGGTQSSIRLNNAGKPTNVGNDGAEMASKSLMQVAQAFGGKFPSNWKASIKIKKDGAVYLSLIDPNGMSRDFDVNQTDDMIYLIQSYANDDGDNPQNNYIRR